MPVDVVSPSNQLVSIGLPVFNAQKTIERAIKSILWQSMNEWELIVIDDGSTDDSKKICRSFNDPRIRLISDGKKRGISRSLNLAVQEAKGKYFARMDADDVSFPKRLENQVAFLEKNEKVDLLGTGMLIFNSAGKIAGVLPVMLTHEEICQKPWWGFYLAHPTWMGRMEWFRENPYPTFSCRKSLLGLIDRAQDQGLLFRTFRTSRFACLPEPLLGYRENPQDQFKALLSRYAIIRYFGQECLKRKDILTLFQVVFVHGIKAAINILLLLIGKKRTRTHILPAPQSVSDLWKPVLDMLFLPENSKLENVSPKVF